MKSDDIRSQLPDVADEDNPLVWCDRCGRTHHLYTCTRRDYDRIIADTARQLADAIDAEAVRLLAIKTGL